MKPSLVLGILAAAVLPSQGLTWISYTDTIGPKQYAVTDISYTWHDALAYAGSVSANLVAINDAAENAWLATTFPGELLWTGGTDQASEGNWAWTNGDPWSYSNWNGGEPNDLTDEEWLHLNWGTPGGWNDFESGADYVNAAQGNTSFQNDSYPVRAILERRVSGTPTTVVPETSTWLGAIGVAMAGALTLRRRARR